jgi:hypothetical protein
MSDSSSRTLIVCDYNWGGHIPAYHRLIVESMLRAGWHVVSLTGFPEEVRRHVAEAAPELLPRLVTPTCPELGQAPARQGRLAFLRWMPGGFALWSRIRTNPSLRNKHALARWSACRSALTRAESHIAGPRILLLPYLDDMLEPGLSAAAVRFETPWMGLHVSASDLREPVMAQAMRQRLQMLAHPSCRGLLLLDDKVSGEARTLARDPVVATLPDIADTTLGDSDVPLVRQLKARAGGRKVVSLLGHLSVAKNIDLFLDLATAPQNNDLFFLMAGQFEALSAPPALRRRIRDAAAGRWSNVWAVPERIPSEAAFNRLVQESDLLFAIYRRFTRSSNILSKAAFFRRPVIVAEGFCMAERAADYRLGLAVAESDREGVEGAIRQLLRHPPLGDYDRFARDFSQDRFAQQLDAALQAGLSKPSHQS